jgi:carotenoid cleavage dioxygenase
VFEPASASSAEDDGVLMGFVYDPAAARSDLMLLDAGTLETVASIHLPDRVPAGFHGNWIPAALR